MTGRSRAGRGRWIGIGSCPHVDAAPSRLGITHWSSRLLASHLKIDASTVLRTWRFYGVQPWRSETFKFSPDPELTAKVTDSHPMGVRGFEVFQHAGQAEEAGEQLLHILQRDNHHSSTFRATGHYLVVTATKT